MRSMLGKKPRDSGSDTLGRSRDDRYLVLNKLGLLHSYLQGRGS
jgi:hypothetical protein